MAGRAIIGRKIDFCPAKLLFHSPSIKFQDIGQALFDHITEPGNKLFGFNLVLSKANNKGSDF